MAQSLFKTLSPLAVVGLEGSRLAPRERALLAEAPPAGIILFSRNVESAGQLQDLVGELEEVFAGAAGRPPIIAADHEGGIVSVLARAIGAPPSQMAAGRAGPALVGRLFEENARRMRACGVNMMLGPVADVNSEPLNPIVGTRSFGERAETVSACVAEAVAAARGAGLLTCLKHFPGHGPTRADSHLSLPVLGATLDELRKNDLVPFARGIEAGADSVMVAHVVAAGRRLPASLDREIVTGVLREELRFNGVIMTDALEMAGVREMKGRPESGASVPRRGSRPKPARSLAEVCTLALAAGNDILLFSKPIAEVAEELESGGAPAGDESFWRGEFAHCLAASCVRIDRLAALIKESRGRGAAQEFNDNVYREVARSSIQMTGGSGSIEPPSIRPALEVVFYSEKDLFERPPVRDFIEQVVTGLSRGGWTVSRAAERGSAERVSKTPGRASSKRNEAPHTPNRLESIAYSFGTGARNASRVIFLMNRRPLEGAAVKRLSAGADVVVVAEWPYAAGLLEPGQRAIVTYGVYGAAAELVCSQLLARPRC